jgi:hypothetical protein
MPTKAEALKAFSDVLVEMKRPYLDNLDSYPDDDTDPQTMDRLTKLLADYDTIFRAVYRELSPIPLPTKITMDEQLVRSVFESRKIFQTIREHPDWKEDYFRILESLLKTYPYTRNSVHIDTLLNDNIESHQAEIISNNEEEDV